jgi:predicted nucleotidyltransferase
MSAVEGLLARLTADAQAADQLHARSRVMLVGAVRTGAAAGLSQREIASAIGRSQPEVSRLLRFHGATPRGEALSVNRKLVIQTIRAHGGRNPRVFGSVAQGTDTDESDIDLLVDFEHVASLLDIARLERELREILGSPVDVVPASNLRANLRSRVLHEAVPL